MAYATQDEAEQATASEDDSASDDSLEQPPHRGPPCVVEDDELFGPYSMAQCIDQVCHDRVSQLQSTDDALVQISHCKQRFRFEFLLDISV